MNTATHRSLRRFVLREKWRENFFSRSIVSHNFQIKDDWDKRLEAPIFKKIKMGEYFFELEKKFTNEYKGSAIDVDIFANNVSTDTQTEHMEELIHKLRRTPHTVHTPDSTHHAAVRAMLEYGEVEHLVKMLDDRLNYGVFMDEFSAILVLDKLLEMGENGAAARCASQLMLQEENYSLPIALGNLGCWRYFSSGRQAPWFYPEEITVDDDPDEVIRVRVPVVPNNYKDNHFDLRDPDHILGKTLIYFNLGREDVVGRSLSILGQHLYGDSDAVVKLLASGETVQPVLDWLSSTCADNEPIKLALAAAKSSHVDVDAVLVEECRHLEADSSGHLIQQQKQIYNTWIENREAELERQYDLMQREGRIEAIQQTKASLQQDEEKLFFFDNLDNFEMEKIEKFNAWRRTLPRTNWNMKNYPLGAHYKKRPDTGEGRKEARWEKREKKLGPPK